MYNLSDLTAKILVANAAANKVAAEEAVAAALAALVKTNIVKGVKLEQVMSVYSGRNGACCCGCAGTHSYASAHRDAGSKNRGYPVDDEDINDRQVTRVFNLIQKNAAIAQVDLPSNISIVLEKRLYVIYLVPSN